MDRPSSLKNKIMAIKDSLKNEANIRLETESMKRSYIQALISRGDRRVGDILSIVDSNEGNWRKVLKSSPLNPDFYVYRERPFDEMLPWDFIDHGIKKSFLVNEYKKALAQRTSPPCPMNSCGKCGLCR
jgi:hypothetical protein